MTNKYYENFEEVLKAFIEARPKEFDVIADEAKNKIKYRSIEDSFSIGKEYLENDDYIEAITIFDELSREDNKVKDLADIYKAVTFAIINSDFGIENDLEKENMIAGKMVDCMKKSSDMYMEKKIKKEELFNIECLIDRVNFRNMKIKEREEFNRVYNKFKEYCILGVYLGGK